MTSAGAEHWDRVYREKGPDDVSWRQESPRRSMKLIDAAIAPEAGEPVRIIDIGAGASPLVDHLVTRGGFEVCAVDVSEAGLECARERLGAGADRVRWLVADVAAPLADVDADWADIWHDRAALHFLTAEPQRRAYALNVARILKIGGAAIIATFAPDGPEKCSGLPVRRADAEDVRTTLETAGARFEIERSEREEHETPWGATQRFSWALLRRVS